MREKPIIFSTPMVQAILAGHKTMTRRVINPQSGRWVWTIPKSKVHKRCCTEVCTASCEWWKYLLPDQLPYKPGDILWVRETWAQTWTPDSNNIGFVYKADGKPAAFPYWGNLKQCKDAVWISSIFMPREAARIFLKVTNVKVERLQDITEEDAIKEGIKGWTKDGTLYKYCVGEVGEHGNVWSEMPQTARDAF